MVNRKNEKDSKVCFGLFHGMELVSFGCSFGVIGINDPSIADYEQVATGMYRVYFK